MLTFHNLMLETAVHSMDNECTLVNYNILMSMCYTLFKKLYLYRPREVL